MTCGGGTGYFEASLLQLSNDDDLNIVGLEVSPHVNKYLSEQNFAYVNGTWDLYCGTESPEVLLFVYPREPRLMARYITRFGSTLCKKIVWIGPSLDWSDYESVLKSSDFTSITVPRNIGIAGYEMLSVAEREGP